MKPDDVDFAYLSRCLEGFFYGLYSAIFAMYLQHHASRKDASNTTNIVFYALCLLYLLSVATIASDLVDFLILDNLAVREPPDVLHRLTIIQTTVFACSDFIAQFILIYRCWIIWDRNIWVVIAPSVIAFAFLPIWIAAGAAPVYVVEGEISTPVWSGTLGITYIAMSMIVNALVTGLIVFRIFKVVFHGVKPTLNERNLDPICRSKLWPIMFVVIESGMVLFSVQLFRLVVACLWIWTNSGVASNTYSFVTGIQKMLNGITPTIILVRVSMGFSFHDENSMVEASTDSLRFVSAHDPNPVPKTQGRGEDNFSDTLFDGMDSYNLTEIDSRCGTMGIDDDPDSHDKNGESSAGTCTESGAKTGSCSTIVASA